MNRCSSLRNQTIIIKMAMMQTMMVNHEKLPKCDTKKHSGQGEAGINYCTNATCAYKEKYFCFDCAEEHDHGAINLNKHIA